MNPEISFTTTHSSLIPLPPNSILYQDGLLLIASKPAGIPIHETKDPKRRDFTRQLQESLGLSYLRTANRLDLNTTGIVVFGVDQHRNGEVDEILKESRKFYLAKVQGLIEKDEFRIESFLKDGNKRVQTVRSGGRKAITECRVIERDTKTNTSLVEAELITGRRHQIRIHLYEYGHPILGDTVYGGKILDSKANEKPITDILYLHSYKLNLEHYKKNLEIFCKPDWLD